MELINKISTITGVPKGTCISLIVTAPRRYKRYEIPKRNGSGTRLIAQPAKSIKTLQRVCIEILRDYLPVHGVAMAYEVGVGIKRNANRHRYHRYVLKMDFSDFFPSITPEVLLNTISRHGVVLSDIDKMVLTNLLFWKPTRHNDNLQLSIGAPSSPFVSNAVMFFFDSMLNEKCRQLGITYTRYADDLIFSTNLKDVLFEVPSLLSRDVLANTEFNFLCINEGKTVFASKRNNRHITGVTITNDGRLSIGRKRKRVLSSLIHKFTTGELKDPIEIMKLKGLLGFAKHIEPIFIQRMAVKYGSEVIEQLKKYPTKI
ncbi:retron St85 family RNA-directed DNA polymerase [Vibrio ziniensis]|uniref:RNA-directed DNA polymerase n=1 Tax=Vibrio ziniensis TaxID=2711221 RepID=A0A6G7CL79_9VIBR|nr:retron St85 family RNA-directed DNA polymerase [Vibrio ziniensis]QIH42859.1 RNA-directed DNA polymerase [Vibrio ziniensis]